MKKRTVTFSKVFPAYHPRKGQPTNFIEAILTQLKIDYTSPDYFVWVCNNNNNVSIGYLSEFCRSLKKNIAPKSHTIRANKIPFEVGEIINPVIWAGLPYKKTKDGFWKIKFAPDFAIKKIWQVEKINATMLIDKNTILDSIPMNPLNEIFNLIAKNDGLTAIELIQWFNKDFSGQIISWNDAINY